MPCKRVTCVLMHHHFLLIILKLGTIQKNTEKATVFCNHHNKLYAHLLNYVLARSDKVFHFLTTNEIGRVICKANITSPSEVELILAGDNCLHHLTDYYT